MKNTRFYRIWNKMKTRCSNPNTVGYKYYGGKGIAVCDEWIVFENFRDDMYKSYLEHVNEYGELNTTIDRKEGDKGYSKDNCRWATIAEQNENTYRNKWIKGISINGEEIVFKNKRKFAREYKLHYSNITKCLKGEYKSTGGWTFYYVQL